MQVAIGIVIALVVVLAGLAAFVASRPSTFQVRREGLVGGAPHEVFTIINDYSRWVEWSPWDKKDLNMKRTVEGPVGPGAVYAWDGNSDVGSGRMTITDVKPGEEVAMRLEFFRPFKGTNHVTFKIEPSGEGSKVAWIMDGTYNFITKGVSLLMDMDKMIGADFELGLKQLDAVARGAKV